MKRILSFILTLVVVASLFASLATSAYAANVCSEISGDINSKTTFQVDTKSGLFKGKLTLTQVKSKISVRKLFGGEKIKYVYAGYTVRIEKISGGSRGADRRTQSWNFSKSCTIKLQKNAVYRITVIPYDSANHTIRYGAFRWLQTPKWKASKTRGIVYCG